MIQQKKHVKDVARIFKVSTRTIYRMIDNKLFDSYDDSKRNFIIIESIMKYIELNKLGE